CKGPNAAHRAIQVAINDAARSIVGCKRQDHIHVAAKTVALETWKCFYSYDGGGGARNPVGDFVHHSSSVSTRKRDGYLCMSCISVWNMNNALRSATTLHAARTAARAIGRSVPT
ncbi:Hypothetical protein FKW44_024315, partial [Caligus rogercresseyi]